MIKEFVIHMGECVKPIPERKTPSKPKEKVKIIFSIKNFYNVYYVKSFCKKLKQYQTCKMSKKSVIF